jgi:hypothetical protein
MNPSLIPQLLSGLSQVPSSATVNNFYISQPSCLANLEQYLRALCAHPYSGHLLVGEAPGYRGCALTGIPFTSERILASGSNQFIATLRPSLVLQGNTAEPSATIVWGHLSKSSLVPALWNAFPFHPHRKNEGNSNRAPNAAERLGGRHYLNLVVAILCPTTVIAIGRKAEENCNHSNLRLGATYVRHPANGGGEKFIEAIKTLGIV